jgi:hypothetical protein
VNEREVAPGLLVRPRRAIALYVLAHGAGAGMRHEFLAAMAELLAERRIATLRWEFPFMRAGKPRVDSPAVAEAAVREAVAAAKQLARGLPLFAGGKSFGGRMTSRAHAAAPLAGVRGLAFLGFPLHPAGKPATERADHLPQATGPLLFVQGTRDELADLALLRPVVQRLGARAELHEVAHADHGFAVRKKDGPSALPEVADVVASWMSRHA